MLSPLYFLSEVFDYRLMIHEDAGPPFARAHKWEHAPLSALKEADVDRPVIIDNRISVEEMQWLTGFIKGGERSVFLRIVDPYWECFDQEYYKWLLTLVCCPNVFFLSPYEPKKLSRVILLSTSQARFLVLPYAYEQSREVVDPDKNELICITGAADPRYYPERAAIIRSVRNHRFAARGVRILPHPGYPDVGHKLQHKLVGNAFIQYLSKHRFMYLEPSADALEFLKYRECAYAGCAPAGRAAPSLPAKAVGLFTTLESEHLVREIRHLRGLGTKQVQAIAQEYREILRHARSPAVLTARLCQHWTQHCRGATTAE